MKALTILIVLIPLLAGCAKIDYVGREYEPTDDVDLFLSYDDVKNEYEVMGHFIVTAYAYVESEKMQEKLLDKARRKGADAVVILGFEKYVTGEETTFTETIETREGLDRITDTRTAETKTSVNEKKELTGVLLKYK